jgi:hypothetical protein
MTPTPTNRAALCGAQKLYRRPCKPGSPAHPPAVVGARIFYRAGRMARCSCGDGGNQMTTLREAAQQALGALEGFAYHGKAAGWPETITSLRAALAQQAPESETCCTWHQTETATRAFTPPHVDASSTSRMARPRTTRCRGAATAGRGWCRN